MLWENFYHNMLRGFCLGSRQKKPKIITSNDFGRRGRTRTYDYSDVKLQYAILSNKTSYIELCRESMIMQSYVELDTICLRPSTFKGVTIKPQE